MPIRFNLQYKTDQQDEISEEEQKKRDEEVKGKLKHEVYPKDEHDDEEFKWEEHSLRNGYKRPVIIHRAILGSVERFSAILIEHIAGKWPFWISPRQAIICPISEHYIDYCDKVQLYLHQRGFDVEVDRSNATLKKKVRNA